MIPSAFALMCDACEPARFASAASIPPGLAACNPPFGRPQNEKGSLAKPGSLAEASLILIF
jgi:hypothetical protein